MKLKKLLSLSLALTFFTASFPFNVEAQSKYERSRGKSGGETAKKSTSSKSGGTKGGGNNELWDYKRKHFNLYGVKDDVQFGEYYMKEQIKAFRKAGVGVDLPKHAALKSRVEQIVQRLAAKSDIPTLPYEVHIFDRPDVVNAFCMPGGKIGVFTGLFDKEKGLINQASDDEIAAVLAHEISHATLRHVTRRLTTYQGINIFGGIASIGLGEGIGANAQSIFQQVFTVGVNLYLPNYSRKHELEADRAGLSYMSKAGFKPQAAIDVWKRAASKGGRNSKKTDFFASHPSDASRAKALEGWLADAELLRSGKKPAK